MVDSFVRKASRATLMETPDVQPDLRPEDSEGNIIDSTPTEIEEGELVQDTEEPTRETEEEDTEQSEISLEELQKALEEGEKQEEKQPTEEPAEFAQLDAYFQKRYGIAPEQVTTVLTLVEQMATKQADRDLTDLIIQEGVSANEVQSFKDRIIDYYGKLPADMKTKLDNADGAKLLIKAIKNANTGVTPTNPSKGRKGTVPKQEQWTEEKIRNLSQAEYEKNIQSIEAFYAARYSR